MPEITWSQVFSSVKRAKDLGDDWKTAKEIGIELGIGEKKARAFLQEQVAAGLAESQVGIRAGHRMLGYRLKGSPCPAQTPTPGSESPPSPTRSTPQSNGIEKSGRKRRSTK